MRMLLYRPGQAPVEMDVDANVESLTPVVGTDQYEWMTVRMLKICVIHDAEGKAAGKPVNRLLGTTPLYGDFLVCGIDWDDDGNTRAVGLVDKQIELLTKVIFTKFPQADDLQASMPSYARKRAEQDGQKRA